MNYLHLKLTSKYPKYNNWHQTKHHNKIHWGVLVVFTLLVFGTISRWTPISFAADIAAPTTPTILTASAVSSSQINLSWTASTDDTGVTGYRVERCQGTGCANFIQISTPTAVSYSDTGLLANTTYRYQVRAVDAVGNLSGYSTIASVTTQVQAFVNTYYVSPTGSATWPQCTDINTPCSAQTGMKNALAGDIVYFRGGTYEVGQSLGAHGVLEPANSGTSTSPITFMAYPGENPVMNATVAQRTSGTATGGSATTLIDTSKDFVALGVSAYNLVVNTTDGSTASVSNVTTNTITFMGNLTQGSRNTFIAGDSYTIGLDISKALGNGDKDYIIFDGFTVQANNGTRMGGIIITGENRGTRVVGNQVKNCIINGGSVKIAHNDNREGLRLDDTTDTTVSGCRFYNFRQEGTGVKDYPNTSAIKTYHNDGIIFENNEIYNSGNGLFLKSKTDNAIVRYNYFHNNYRSLMIAIFYSNQAFNTNGNKYYHNVFANNTFSAFASDTQCGTTYYANDAEIFNNTIYNSVRGISYMQNEPGHGAKVYNNIIQGNSNLQLIGICEPAELIEEDHNQFGTAPLTIGMRLYGVTQKNYTNLSPSWIGSSELVGGNHPGAGSLRSDPLFVNGSGTFTQLNDFKLSNSSPSKGTGRNGADMGANIDLVGPAGTGKDITPPSIPILTATAISSSQINLSWTASTDDVGVTGYKIYRCSGTGCTPTVQIATSAVNSYSDTGLTASTVYTYVVSAYDAAGNESGKSAAVSMTTQAQTGVNITGVSGTLTNGSTITITGTGFGTKTAAAPFRWDNFESCATDSDIVAICGYNNEGGDGSKAYIKTDRAYGVNGVKSAKMDYVASRSSMFPRIGKNISPGVTEVYISHMAYFTRYSGTGSIGSFIFKWTRAGSNPPYSGVPKFYDTVRNDSSLTQNGSDRGYVTDAGTTWSQTVNSGQNGNQWNRVEYYYKLSTPGTANGTFQQRVNGVTNVNLTNALTRTSAENSSLIDYVMTPFEGLDSYIGGFYLWVDDYYIDTTQARIEICNASTKAASTQCEIQIPSAWSATSNTITVNQGSFSDFNNTYLYVVDSDGNVNESGYPVTIGGVPSDIQAPTTPTTLTATPISSSQINLSWTASTDNVGVTGYKIYRCAGFGCAPTAQIATSAANSYSDTGLTASTAYTYAVSAYDAAGNESGKSGAMSVTTLSQFKPSDLNQDRKVDQQDFDILKQDWNRTDKPVSDINQDGVVDSRDLGIMMSSWEN